MMTFEQVMVLVDAYEEEHRQVGFMGTSDRLVALRQTLESDEARIFQCEECGEFVSYFDLEGWVCDFEEGEYVCSACYEDEMGWDL